MHCNLRNGFVLRFTQVPMVMGIINCTPDSFYTPSRAASTEAALRTAETMAADGVQILDIGGESTRPGSVPVMPEEEKARIIPVIRAIHQRFPAMLLSVDTRNADTAKAALDAGCSLVNDVSGLKHDPRMAACIASEKAAVILMHMRGTPQTMQNSPWYKDTVAEVKEELSWSVQTALKAGIGKEQILLDPGIGFSKRPEDNWRILANLNRFSELGFPLVLGVSRKSFLGVLLDEPPEHRLFGSLTAQCWAMTQGIQIIRVHDVKPAVQAVKVFESILTHRSPTPGLY